jgi:hypothetical protein
MTLPFGMGDVPATVTPPLPAPAASATVPPPNAPAPPEKTDWGLVILSGVAVSLTTSLFWLAIEHTHRAIKKTNRKLAKR